MVIKDYISLVWRWAWLIILGVIVAGAGAYIFSKNTTPVYRASSRLLIDEAPGSNTGNDYSQVLFEQRLAQTYVEILTTTPILQKTVEQLDLPLSPGQLRGKITVSAPQDTQIIVITVEDTDPARTAAIANALGNVFIAENQARDSLRYAEPIGNWQGRLNEIGDTIQSLETQINELSTAESAEDLALRSRLETQLNEAQIRYTEAFNNLNQLQTDQAKENSNLVPIEPATVPGAPIRPRTVTNTLLAMVVGGMVALGLIFLIEYLDDSIKSPDQIMEDTGLTTLGAIANIKSDSLPQTLVTQLTPRDPISEAYRVIRTNLSFSAVDEGLRSVLVTSSSPGEGKSTTTANLAVVMAQAGKRTILVDSDLRRPVQHKIFETPNNFGLTTAVLDSESSVIQHVQETKIPFLRIMTSGPIPPNPAELLSSQRMNQLVQELQSEADIVIFDTPPVLTVADASILSALVTGCLVVVDTGKTKRNTFIGAIERLQRTGGNIFGAVLNKLNPDRRGYGYYYYYYNLYEYNNQTNKRRSSRKNRSSKLPAWLSGLTRR
ncbi:MAG: polysaccharide biosynthesis tyrosine autokinase [Anaerolineales bacterium]|nr:polysaccharide biosynthesis tyrosine autokinase [Anaerolineales bacterium]